MNGLAVGVAGAFWRGFWIGTLRVLAWAVGVMCAVVAVVLFFSGWGDLPKWAQSLGGAIGFAMMATGAIEYARRKR